MATIKYKGKKGIFSGPDDEQTKAVMEANGYLPLQATDSVDATVVSPAAAAAANANRPPPEGVIPGLGGSVPPRQQLAGMDPWGFAKVAFPSIAATIASGGVGPEAGLLEQFLAPYLASTGTRAGLTKMSGGEPGMEDLTGGLYDAVPLVGGNMLAKWISRLGAPKLAAAYNVGRGPAGEAIDIASQQASRGAPRPVHVPYSNPEAAIEPRLERMGILPGPPPTRNPLRSSLAGVNLTDVAPETGSSAIRGAMSSPMDERALILRGFSNGPQPRITRMTFSGSPRITEAREAIRRGFGTPGVRSFNTMLDDWINGGTELSHGNPRGNVARGPGNRMRPMTLQEVEPEKEALANAAKYGTDPQNTAIRAQLNRALSDAQREFIESFTPPAVPGGVGRIEALNREYQSMLPLRDVIDAAELPRGPDVDMQKIFNEGRFGYAMRHPAGTPQLAARYGPEALTTIARIMNLARRQPAEQPQ